MGDNNLLSCLNNDVKMIVYKVIFDDVYGRVKEDFNKHFVPIWDDERFSYHRAYRPVASWRKWNELERKNQSTGIYDDIWLAARRKHRRGYEYEVAKLHKDYYYRECFY